ncbi:glyoxalase [Oerskovia turbata]|uniref:Glyoxalase n=1 Tax=Oerskovia turbata TaxID=1713 RepID=A0A4Q1L308_9CELL|nr:VOC family protein [Oerskovia turbata]QDW64403.1 glyoxalase [Oerskovia sp. KBS0722]RXR27068.1 glyoxalase [Oerskovia turbata]RXR36364.1 glyoxalase [Oerskovia turbata]TGJ94678.1 glyoxalase [Actinotalea fermentans ATCC 43279 = JCM 9966 = DSM 3133]
MTVSPRGELHHVELWVEDLDAAESSWAWLLDELGYTRFQTWASGQSWLRGATYIVLEASPAARAARHDRLRPGLNHLAFSGGRRTEVDDLVTRAAEHGWSLMFADAHPYAGGPQHYAAYLENADGFEVEIVAADD